MVEDCMNFLLSVSQHKVFKHYGKLLEKYEITPAQAGILTCIWHESEKQITPTELGKKLHLEAPTISGILDKMQKQKLISRDVDPNNRRVVFVSTTIKANKLKKNIENATESMNKDVLNSFSDEEVVVLKAALLRLIDSDLP